MFNIGNVSRICTFDCSSSNYLIAINGAYPMVSYYSDIGTVFQNTNVHNTFRKHTKRYPIHLFKRIVLSEWDGCDAHYHKIGND